MLVKNIVLCLCLYHERNDHFLKKHTCIDTMRLCQTSEIAGQAFSQSRSHANWRGRIEDAAFWNAHLRHIPPLKFYKYCLTHLLPFLSSQHRVSDCAVPHVCGAMGMTAQTVPSPWQFAPVWFYWSLSPGVPKVAQWLL